MHPMLETHRSEQHTLHLCSHFVHHLVMDRNTDQIISGILATDQHGLVYLEANLVYIIDTVTPLSPGRPTILTPKRPSF